MIAIIGTAYGADDIPALPHIFYGKSLSGGSEAKAIVEGVVYNADNPISITDGKIGGSSLNDKKLMVQGQITPNSNISFTIDGKPAKVKRFGVWYDTIPFSSGSVNEIELQVSTTATPTVTSTVTTTTTTTATQTPITTMTVTPTVTQTDDDETTYQSTGSHHGSGSYSNNTLYGASEKTEVKITQIPTTVVETTQPVIETPPPTTIEQTVTETPVINATPIVQKPVNQIAWYIVGGLVAICIGILGVVLYLRKKDEEELLE